ncbi:hypothetical protein [Enterococcus sp. UD-01]|uniref:hypothetical protein n=1 Tax=Enterococcus sp. UD-01 TaxID=3373911 RepID=UPI00384B5D46
MNISTSKLKLLVNKKSVISSIPSLKKQPIIILESFGFRMIIRCFLFSEGIKAKCSLKTE